MSAVGSRREPSGNESTRIFEPVVRGESLHDQVTSILMASVIGALLVVGWLLLIYATNQAYASRVTAPLEIIDVYGGGGGSPEGTAGSTEKIDVAGAEVAPQASNNEEEAGDFEDPSVQETPAAMLDAVAEAGESLAEVDLGAVMPSGSTVASGKRASKLGTGGPGIGMGPGDGGFAPEQRWSIIFKNGDSVEEYARELDALHVELAVVLPTNQLEYVSNFSSPEPTKRFGTGRKDGRLYFLWQGGGRKASDLALLKKAGIEVGDNVPVLQFYPAEVENTLRQLEVRYRGRQPAEIRVTRFQVVPSGTGYEFKVIAQEALR
jgi:rhodanese-related sulfurtransferase